MIGQTVNQYHIIDRLGEGGMGVVYLAKDTRLHRKAALKFISSELNRSSKIHERFVREAQAAARLSHPNICTVYELGRNDTYTFIALEYVKGQTLRERMQLESISYNEIRSWLRQLAEGLLAAHELGVVHRDVKPANIMITDKGHIKIMDFGIAKLNDAEQELTQGESTIGTISYMSPEQARGEKVDHRTDIWSLGIILYELATGQRPFDGAFREAFMYRLMHEEMTPPSSHNSEIPADLDKIITTCLQRERASRYASLADLLVDIDGESRLVDAGSREERSSHITEASNEKPTTDNLVSKGEAAGVIIDNQSKKWIGGVSVATLLALMLLQVNVWFDSENNTSQSLSTAMHLAVLPFDSYSESEENESFSNGLAHMVATNLMRMEHDEEDLWIVPVREVLSQNILSAGDAREKFGINLVLSGTIIQLEQLMQITIDLTDAQTLRVIDSATIELEDTKPDEIQLQLVNRLADMLGLEIPAGTDQIVAQRYPEDPEAYKLFIQGQGFMQRYDNMHNLDEAIRYFERAIRIDSTFALAFAEASRAYGRKYYYTKNLAFKELAISLSEKALELDNEAIEVWIAWSIVDPSALEKALAIDPNNYQVNLELLYSHTNRGEFEKAEEYANKTITLQPNYWSGYNAYALLSRKKGEFDKAIELLSKVIELTPDNGTAFHNLGLMYLHKQDTINAVDMFLRAVNSEPKGQTYRTLGWIERARKNYHASLEHFLNATQVTDKNENYQLELGNAYFLANDFENARTHWRESLLLAEDRLDREGDIIEIVQVIAEVQARLANTEEALKYIDKYKELMTPGNALYTSHNYMLAYLHELIGDRDTALEYIAKLFEEGWKPSYFTNDIYLAAITQEQRYLDMASAYSTQ